MTAGEKYNEEKDEMKTARMTRILAAGFELFSIKGIDTIAMTDIAKKAEIGVASLYRYFSTKDEIAIRTAIWAWENQKEIVLQTLKEADFENQSGIRQMEIVFEMFIKIFRDSPDFLRFIYFFDSYIVRSAVDTVRLTDYENLIQTVQQIISAALKKGVTDGTINKSFETNLDTVYFALMHSFFSTAQKLSLSGSMLNMDKAVNGVKELETLSKIIIAGIKN